MIESSYLSPPPEPSPVEGERILDFFTKAMATFYEFIKIYSQTWIRNRSSIRRSSLAVLFIARSISTSASR
jgi:hypothetical protein